MRPFLARSVLVLVLIAKAPVLTLFLFNKVVLVTLLVRKAEWDEDKGRQEGGLGMDRVIDEISIFVSKICFFVLDIMGSD